MRRVAFAACIVSVCAVVAIAQAPEPETADRTAAGSGPADGPSAPAREPPTGAVGRFATSAPLGAESTAAKPAADAGTTTTAAAPADDAESVSGKGGTGESGAGDADGASATATAAAATSAAAGSVASGTPPPLPAAKPKQALVAAKQIFGHLGTPAPLAARAIGFYSRGCLAGGVALPIDGEVWQAMRLSRNRNWGHPRLIALIERLAEDAAAKDGWPGLLVGDLSQPRGGPMLTGHNSHQVGLDADIWLTPMPERRLSQKERERMPATSMLASDGVSVDPEVFTPYHAALIRRAASYPDVERIFVHPAIKKAMCEEAGADRRHFNRIRPYWGHHYHMHIRIGCPKESGTCRAQAPIGTDDGCGSEVDDWLARLKRPPKPEKPPAKAAPRKPRIITLDDLPAECSEVAAAGAAGYAAPGGRGANARRVGP